jgi:hypothetical protein
MTLCGLLGRRVAGKGGHSLEEDENGEICLLTFSQALGLSNEWSGCCLVYLSGCSFSIRLVRPGLVTTGGRCTFESSDAAVAGKYTELLAGVSWSGCFGR